MSVSKKRVKILVLDVPEQTQLAVDHHAAVHNISRNEVVLQALIDRYRLKPPENVTRYRPFDTKNSTWSLEVPTNVRSHLRLEAARKNATISGIVRLTLAEKFGLPKEEPTRRPRGSRAA